MSMLSRFSSLQRPSILFVASARTQNTVIGDTLTINKPTGTVQGDLMIAVISANGSSGTWTSPAGWTEVADEGSRPNLCFSYRVAGASEGASYTFTCSFNNQRTTGCILTYRNAAYDAVGAFAENTDPIVAPAVTASAAASVLIGAAVRDAPNVTISTPSGMTARVTDNDADQNSYIVCDQYVNAGSTGTRSFTMGNSGNTSGALLVIKPN